MCSRWVLLLAVLFACGRERGVTPQPRDRLAPWRYVVDELASDDLDRHPIAKVGDVTRYVVAELPALQLASRLVARNGTDAELVIECPPQFSGRPITLRVARLLAPANQPIGAGVQASPRAKCPAETGAPVSLRLSGVRAPEMDGSEILLIGTAEPAPRVATRWLRIPTAAVLEVSFGMANPAKAAALPAAHFEIRAEGRDGVSVTLLQRDVAAEPVAGQREWRSERIVLGRDVERLGPEARLVFETSVAERDRPAFPVWGDPVILVPTPTPAPERRNVVLISLDTMRADRLGCYGAIGENTPALDRIAGEGTLFETAIAAAPWTAPSHATLLTGFYGCVHRVGLSGHNQLPAGISPLPELLRNAGYTTAAFTEGGYLHGFHRGFGLYSAPGDSFAKRPWGDVDRTVDDASRWLTHEALEPFFLFVHTYQVHAPYNAPPPYADILRPDDGGPLASRALAVRSRVELARYDEEVRYTDSVMGRLFSTLDGLGLSRRTIVVIVADHGEAFGEHGFFQHVLSLEDEVMRVPFIWFAPGLVAAGRRIPTVAGLIDVTPTLLDLLGIKPPPVIEGLSLASFLRDVDPPIGRGAHRFVFAERMLGDSPHPVLVRGPWWRATFGPTGPLDVNVIAGDGLASPAARWPAAISMATAARALYEDRCRRLPRRLPRERSRAQPTLPDPDHEQRLRALGYVE